jgi:hypothetical protein
MVSNTYMNGSIEFRAPWSRGLRSISCVAVACLVAAFIAGLYAWSRTGSNVALIPIAAPPFILLIAALCIVRGYVLTNDEIVVKRLGWANRFALADLRSVHGDNEVMSKSLRLLGNTGLLSYSGYFWNRKIGRYRAFATDPSRAVVLTYAKRKILLTPDDPQRFIVRVRTLLKNQADERGH